MPGCEHITAYAIDGPPGLCVCAGRLGAFGDPPDIVVSGVNPGCNTGRAILHSGTVGAALTAQSFGCSALAVSVAVSDPYRFDTAVRIALDVLPMLLDAPARSVLNLNVPALDYDDVLGVRWARLAAFGSVRAAIAESERRRSAVRAARHGRDRTARLRPGSRRRGLRVAHHDRRGRRGVADVRSRRAPRCRRRSFRAPVSTRCTRCPTRRHRDRCIARCTRPQPRPTSSRRSAPPSGARTGDRSRSGIDRRKRGRRARLSYFRGMPIAPDTKNWTWVLERPCPECGFDATQPSGRDDVAPMIRANAQAWQRRARGRRGRRATRRRRCGRRSSTAATCATSTGS